MRQISFIKSLDCPLCDKAMEMLLSANLEGFTLVEEDIYSKRDLHDKYWDKIPVIINGNKVLFWPFDQKNLDIFLS